MSSIYIFRRDFRTYDNTGLIECVKNSDKVYPIFIFTPEQINNNPYKSNNAVMFMIESLKELNKDIKVTFCYGDYIKVISDVVKNNKIDNIYTNTDYSKYGIKRDKNIDKWCKKKNIKFHMFHDICLQVPGTVKTGSGKIYQKFTPFYNTCIKLNVDKPSRVVVKNITNAKTKYEINMTKINSFYEENENINVHGGRKEALKILRSIGKYKSYGKSRNLLPIETTQLSAYIKFGCVSIREVFHIMKQKLGLKHDLIKQLIWRDFYYHLGYGFIERFRKSLKEKYDNIEWVNNPTLFKKWKEGNTGYPVVDACMRQLNEIGYMHNRGRLIVASFLIKNLQINWEWGEKYFAQQLIDYDVLVNNGNWQWVSGSGADSQPYFRIFNPWTQSERFDKDCEYIKYWLPELENLENKHIHQWDKYHEEYEDVYIKPVIDYKKSREITLKMYKKGLY